MIAAIIQSSHGVLVAALRRVCAQRADAVEQQGCQIRAEEQLGVSDASTLALSATPVCRLKG